MNQKSPPLSAKPAIDLAFYEKLNQLSKARGPMRESGLVPEAPPALRVPAFFKDNPLPCLQKAAQALPSSEPRLQSSPKIISSWASKLCEEAAVPCDAANEGAMPRQARPIIPEPVPLSSGSRSSGGSSFKMKGACNRYSPDSSLGHSPNLSPSPSPRSSTPQTLSVTSVSSTPSSANSSPSTTPRGNSARDKHSGARKLQRKLTQKAEDIAAAVREAFKGQGNRSRAGSGERDSPQTPESPRVRFGSVDLVDMQVALDDADFRAFVHDAADAAFMKPWKSDTSDVTDIDGNPKRNATLLKPTFIRDFGNSLYFCPDETGKQVKLEDTDQFIRYLGHGQTGDLSRIVSNIASQNLGNFLKNTLFLRQDAQKKSHSVLTLSDGTPIMPLAVAKARYTFSRSESGELIIDYVWESSAELNRGKPLRAKTLDAQNESFEVSKDAKLKISTRITIASNGDWHIADPRVQASGWKRVEST